MAHRTSLPRICIALGFPSVEKLLDHARQEVEAGESFFEFRLDYLNSPELGVNAIREFLALHPDCTILATCRRHQNQGRYNGSIEEQVRILAAAIEAGATAVDIEIESAENVAARLDLLRGNARMIVSYHNYEGTPATAAILRRMQKVAADAYKIVTTARKPSDNLRVLELSKANPRVPIIVLAMGEAGFPTRVLATAWGGLFTYAAPNSGEGTASGQVSARQLRHLYRVEKFTKAAKVYGVVADPVRQSISPNVHNRAFQARRMDAVYLPFLVLPAQLKDFFTLADKVPVTGFSVTIPHKQKILRYLDIVDPLARRIGAVNTVWKKAGKWRGANTDAEAVTIPLGKKIRLAKSTVLLLGNGGAARSAAYALVECGAKVSIAGRNPDRVRALAKACGAEAISKEQAESRMFDALVHATPLGMFPHVDQCFFEDKIPAGVVFDMVYNPIQTLLAKRACEQGRVVVPGIQMFLEQAAQQFEIWTGGNGSEGGYGEGCDGGARPVKESLPAKLTFNPDLPLTDDDYFDLCMANPDVRFERTTEGEIIIVPPCGMESDGRSLDVGSQLRQWAKRERRGKAIGSSTEFILPNRAALSPDAAWISDKRMAVLSKKQRRGFAPVCPEFVVQVMSSSDRLKAAQAKMLVWLDGGVELGWLIDGDNKTVYVYRAGCAAPDELTGIATLGGEGPVAGFELDLTDIWAGL